jgi:ribosomal protein S18 acetylase RimI-like enzyme
MHHLEHSLDDLPAPEQRTELRLETFRSVRHEQFTSVLQRTYEGTLDCPELNGVRTLDEIITGHRAEGKFSPDRWWLALHEDRPVGVVLLAELLDGLSWDLSYLGLAPEARGRGLGRALLDHALHFAREHLATRLILSVDGRNEPARRLYRAAGFTEFESREVLLQFLQAR